MGRGLLEVHLVHAKGLSGSDFLGKIDLWSLGAGARSTRSTTSDGAEKRGKQSALELWYRVLKGTFALMKPPLWQLQFCQRRIPVSASSLLACVINLYLQPFCLE